MSGSDDIIARLRADPALALEVARAIEPVGDWEARTINKPRHEEQLIRRNHLGHVVAHVGSSWGKQDTPGREFCAWMTYPLRSPHGIYRATAQECMVAADTELQENPKCLLVNPRSPD